MDGRQQPHRRVIDTTRLPAIEKQNLVNFNTNLELNDIIRNKNAHGLTTNHFVRSQDPEVSPPLAYPAGSSPAIPVSCRNRYEYRENMKDFGSSSSPSFSTTSNEAMTMMDGDLILQSFNQNATNNSEETTNDAPSDYPEYYLENYHDLASCSCDMDCFQPPEEPKRTFKRPDQYFPYITPEKYKRVPPMAQLPRFRQNMVPYPWGAPTRNTKRAPNQTKYPLPTLTYPYTLMFQSIFKHYELNEKTDTASQF